MSKLGVELHKEFAIFRVWAPFAKTVALQGDFSDWSEIPMVKNTGGTWAAKIMDAKAGQSYRYVITSQDGKRLEKNDPRARALTDGDQGVSVIAADDFDWGRDNKFQMQPREKQVVYELHIGTFNRPDAATIGTFATAIEKLDHLRDLGITMIELMPVTAMAMGGGGGGWGYSPKSIYAVQDSYGGAAGLKSFVKAAHERGIAVVLDTVYNHFFSGTLWQFDGWSENNRGGIYFYNDERGDTPWGGRPDYGRPEVRDFILDNVAMWLTDYHVDGLRLDSTIHMRNVNGRNNDPAGDIAEAWGLLQEITTLAHKVRPSALMIAEDCAGNEWITKPIGSGGCGFDVQWDLGLPHVIRGALGIGNEPSGLSHLIDVMKQSFNGDFYQKVIFADSHDTAANGGKRLASSKVDPHCVDARGLAILSSAVALTAPGIPMLLAGSEFLQGGDFNDWAALDFENLKKFSGVVEAHKDLINLRKNIYSDANGLLSDDIQILLADETFKVLLYQRGSLNAQAVIVVANFNSEKVKDYQLPLPSGTWRVRFNSSWKGYSPDFAELRIEQIDSTTKVDLPPYVCLILTKN